METNCLCALRVDNETRVWEEGKALVFCDALEHEALNQDADNRTVLILDFKNRRYKSRILNSILSVEFVEFIKKVRWPEMIMRERLVFRFWQLVNCTRKIAPAGYSPQANKKLTINIKP